MCTRTGGQKVTKPEYIFPTVPLAITEKEFTPMQGKKTVNGMAHSKRSKKPLKSQ